MKKSTKARRTNGAKATNKGKLLHGVPVVLMEQKAVLRGRITELSDATRINYDKIGSDERIKRNISTP